MLDGDKSLTISPKVIWLEGPGLGAWLCPPFPPYLSLPFISPQEIMSFLARKDKELLRMKLTDCANQEQHHIHAHIPRLNDLIDIMLVLHHFQDLAELPLYRTMQFKVPCIRKEYVNLESSNESLDDTLHNLQEPIRLLETLTAHLDLGCKIGRLSLAVPSWAWYTLCQLRELFRSLPELRGLCFTPPPVRCAPL